MPRVTIALIEGRTLEQKRQLVKGVTDVICETCKVPPSSVTIQLQDMKKEDYAQAGVLRCDQ